MYIDKDRFQQGQRRNTRSQGLIDRLEVKVRAAMEKYRAARHAISTLSPLLNQYGWDVNFPVLNDSDIRGLTDASAPNRSKKLHKSGAQDTSTPAHSKGLRDSEGRREITWIWKRLGTLENGDELLQDGMYRSLFSPPAHPG